MNAYSKRQLGVLLVSLILFNLMPIYHVSASLDITEDTTWSGLVELTQDIRVTNGATLTIMPGTTVRVVSADAGSSGDDPDLVEILIVNGYLEVDSATFDAAAGYEWYGIHIHNNGHAEILNSEITDCVAWGVRIDTLNEVVLSGCEIHDINGKNGSAPTLRGGGAVGIYIIKGDHIINGNNIHHIQGGMGQSSVNPGGDGGEAHGILIDSGAPLIESNIIDNIEGGQGGSGSAGAAGTNGGDGGSPGDPGSGGSPGGAGGDAGDAGNAYGIYAIYADGIQIVGNEISNITGGNSVSAGSGGTGGTGGNGAVGAIGSFPGGAGGNGGTGGDGGDGGSGGNACGLYLMAESVVLTDNYIDTIHGGYGTQGGQGGNGGTGGTGGEGGDGILDGVGGPGGAGGDGGNAGAGGVTGQAGMGTGVYQYACSFTSYSRNRIQAIYGGSVWVSGVAGSGGDGGTGGRGGDGGASGGTGGAGGNGGAGADGVYGGDSGRTYGISINNFTSNAMIDNAIISGVQAMAGKNGSDAGSGGNGGNGGNGGSNSVSEKAAKGIGGDGGNGGNGGDGGNGEGAYLFYAYISSATLINNTLFNPNPGDGGAGGASGAGGAGGEGSTVGSGGSGGISGSSGHNATAIGVGSWSSSTLEIYNTIIKGCHTLSGIPASIGIAIDLSSLITSDYNDVHGFSISYWWGGCTPGAHDFIDDPLFVDPAYGDLHLQTSSPCIDKGNNTAAGVPDEDFDRKPRPLDGDEDGSSVVDIGAYELGGFTLTVTAEHGSVTKAPDKVIYNYNDVVTLAACGDSGYSFSHWTGDASGTDNPLTISIQDNTNITAIFVIEALKTFLPLILQ